ncbi:MAG: TorA maturation chaperone TorD [Parasphingorhabdus sp.]|jgi:TorA maturation chaperone TorD
MTQTISGSADVDTESSVPAPENQYRSGAYGYLAALLRAEPDANLLAAVSGLGSQSDNGDDLATALTLLGMAAKSCPLESVADEYFKLFIGLGRGELVPFGSWYQTGFLMEKPLGILRDDLKALGFERDSKINEPEDHVAALFEVMAMLIGEDYELDQQKVFFERHLASWVKRFFDDLAGADTATFYQSVARFGNKFIEFEKRYLGMPV